MKNSQIKKVAKMLLDNKIQNLSDEKCLVPPHPDLQNKIVKEIKKLRESKTGLMADKITIQKTDPVGMDDGLIYPGTLFPLGTTADLARQSGLNRSPLTGTVRVIIVLVNFSDVSIAQSVQHYRDLFFSTSVIPTGSVREYYHEVSNGLVDIQGDVIGPVTLSHNKNYYANGSNGMGATPNARTMAAEAAVLANAIANFAPYDNDGDNYIDAYIVIHPGQGGEVTGNVNDIWSHKWVLPSVYAADGKNIYAYLTIPEDSKIGVCAHELGHLLFGFPDLYDTDYSSEGIGNWCLMAGGSWNNGGLTPAHPSAWCKVQQNWATVVNVTANALTNIEDVKSGHKIYRLWQNGGAGSEYFLVENRQKTGFDSYLPGGGLLIWHIDDAITNNTNENHYKVALIQADGQKDLELHHSRGDAGDPYPGTTNNRVFNDSSTPNSKSYAGSSTCVAVSNISVAGTVMTAQLNVRCVKLKEFSKEIIKEKEIAKDLSKESRKEFRKELVKEIRKEFSKEIFEKNTNEKLIEAKFVNPKVRASQSNSIEQRLSDIEDKLNMIEPFINQELRPDLSMGAYMSEDDLAPSGEVSHEDKRILDTKTRDV